jgi:sporulation protein YunB
MPKRKLSAKMKRIRGIAVFAFLLTAAVMFLTIYYQRSIMPTVRANVEASVRATGTEILNTATSSAIENTQYEEFFEIVKDIHGDIILIRINPLAINALVRDCAQLSQTALNAIGQQNIQISLGSFVKIAAFAGRGPSVNIRYTPVGSSSCTFETTFAASGINQTLHSLYVNVSARMVVSTAAYKFESTLSSRVLVCEDVLIGKVPDTYLTIGNLDLTV